MKDLTLITGELDSGIAGVVFHLRNFGIDTFASCEGGGSHSFPNPTVRVNVDDPARPLEEMGQVVAALYVGGYVGYYLKFVSSYQLGPEPYEDVMPHFIEVEFWQPAPVLPLAKSCDTSRSQPA